MPGARALTASVSAQHHAEREWLFGLLRQGMRDKHCYALYARRGVLPVVLAFFSSPLCGPAAQVGAAPSLCPSVRLCVRLPQVQAFTHPKPHPQPTGPRRPRLLLWCFLEGSPVRPHPGGVASP